MTRRASQALPHGKVAASAKTSQPAVVKEKKQSANIKNKAKLSQKKIAKSKASKFPAGSESHAAKRSGDKFAGLLFPLMPLDEKSHRRGPESKHKAEAGNKPSVDAQKVSSAADKHALKKGVSAKTSEETKEDNSRANKPSSVAEHMSSQRMKAKHASPSKQKHQHKAEPQKAAKTSKKIEKESKKRISQSPNKHASNEQTFLPLVESMIAKHAAQPSIDRKELGNLAAEVREIKSHTAALPKEIQGLKEQMTVSLNSLKASSEPRKAPNDPQQSQLLEAVQALAKKTDKSKYEVIDLINRASKDNRKTADSLSALAKGVEHLLKLAEKREEERAQKKIRKASPAKHTAKESSAKAESVRKSPPRKENAKKPSPKKGQERKAAKPSPAPNLKAESHGLATLEAKPEEKLPAPPAKPAESFPSEKSAKPSAPPKKPVAAAPEGHKGEESEPSRKEGQAKTPQKAAALQGKSPIPPKHAEARPATAIEGFHLEQPRHFEEAARAAPAKTAEPKPHAPLRAEEEKRPSPAAHEQRDWAAQFPFDARKPPAAPAPKAAGEGETAVRPPANKDIVVSFNAQLPSEPAKHERPFSYGLPPPKPVERPAEERKDALAAPTASTAAPAAAEPAKAVGGESRAAEPQPVKIFFDKTDEGAQSKPENFLAPPLEHGLKSTEKKNFFS